MARPKKEGLDYFPLDVDIDQDDKVIIIIAKYGIQGFGILIKLLMAVYKNGYSYQWTEKEQIIFSSRVNVDINLVNDVVNDCIKWGLFHEEIYKEYKVLTSKGIQERYLLAASRRVDIAINDNIKLVSVNINTKSEEKTPAKSTQSKRKETKSNKTIKTDSPNELAFVDFWEVYPRKEDKKKALEKFKAACKKYEPQMIIDGAKKYAEQCRIKGTEKQFIKLAPTFLNAESFTNDFDTAYSEGGQARTGTHQKQNKIDWGALEAMVGDE